MGQSPDWMDEFVNLIAKQIVPVDVMAPLGCHIARNDDCWEITLFASATEVVGGPQDGGPRPSHFFVDLQGFSSIFHSIDSLAWQAQGLGRDDEIGPHVSVEGDFRGHRVWLRIPAYAPRRFPPGRRADVNRQLWEEVW